ncbi:flagellar biosynthesis protein FlhA [Egicoccus halophilus]|uniref:Flagellar biosynthesis protein FlhA n=1 Tax=Egicoccus halophilus TaxID=1670830 RepID=A0A8J3ES79_9ACTN|nr:flagellar biosynthesis protein FlhA [Egicoccus halophilus]GGI06731.1 flagellar biosynthesis protein FlhA [Egicoccus halophilus]
MSTLPTTAKGGRNLARTAVPLLLIGAVIMMVVPIPPMLLDLMLALNLAFALLILLSVLTLRDTLALSSFPSLILLTTLMRLALNVSSTRLILLEGYAGKVIATFGSFVVGGSIIVGLVVFLILVVIQFVVITNGAGRVAEVGARFALDAMPGKQMAIDADLAAGLINEAEARERRTRISQESDFYGAMDGASKFVKGDAIAGIIITAINLIGGLVIGITVAGLSAGEAASTYSLLTVGDGLISQIPALLVSAATGLLVSRVDGEEDLGPIVGRQLMRDPRVLRIAAGVMGGLGLLPGLPKLPFLVIVVSLLVMASRAAGDNAAAVAQAAADGADADGVVRLDPDDPRALIDQLRVEPLELHLAYDVLDLTDPEVGGDLLQRVRALRRQIGEELGLVMPLVRTADDVTLPAGSYRILLHGVEVARGTAPRDRVLALPAVDGELGGVPGEETVEPVFGLKAYWVPMEARSRVTATGATVVDRSAVVVTHLAEIARRHAGELLSRQQVQQLVESLRYDEPLLADEVGTETLPMALLHDVLRELLRERVSIRDLGRVVEAVSTRARETRSMDQLVGAARVAIGAGIVARVAPDGHLGAITLSPVIEGELHERVRDIDGTLQLVVEPERLAPLIAEAADLVQRSAGTPVAIICGQLLRRPLRDALTASGVDVAVLAYPELPNHLQLNVIGALGVAHADV